MQLDNRPRPVLSLGPDAPEMALGRAHEATGAAAIVFAALIAGRMRGPVLWARPSARSGALNPEGLSSFFDPARLVIASIDRPIDILWTAEEALRSGAAPLVVAEVAEPPGLTPLRRLQLAAESGGDAARKLSGGALANAPAYDTKGRETDYSATGCRKNLRRNEKRMAGDRSPPLCLLISPRAGSAGAVESRWRCAPLPAWGAGAAGEIQAASPRWRFERVYGKSGPPLVWTAGGDAVRRRAA